MSDNAQLVYVALGGAGEIGMNMYLYGYGPASDRKWIMVDCGVAFGDMASSPGVDLVMPDVEFVQDLGDRLVAIFITHAHEDHVGAIGRLWPRLRAPIFAPLFTAEIAKRKMAEAGQPQQQVNVVGWDSPVEVGGFSVSFLPVTHSIPDPAMLLIETPAGRVVHTGDFKLDPAPVIGAPTDMDRLAEIGDKGVLALMCDSTNVFEDGEAGGEQPLRPELLRIITQAKGAVAATTFASNVGRLKTLAEVAVEAGRSIVVAGRAMRRMIETAVETGALESFPTVVSEDNAKDLPAENLFYLITGSQGEGRAALARIANDTHPGVKLRSGDTVLFSSKTIPGNEKEVYRLYNLLAERGIEIVDSNDAHIHVSGHACRDEIRRMHEVLRPQIVTPMHGEHRHLAEHARMAKEWTGAQTVVAANGAMVALDGNSPRVVSHVETGRLYLDGETLVGALDGVIRARLKLARQGHVAVSLVVDEEGELFADPQVIVEGAPSTGDWDLPLDELISARLDAAITSAPRRERTRDSALEELGKRVTRKACSDTWGKKPTVSVMVTRLEAE
ncbi:MAG: ribonuclease J [Pikeienuella sp.]